MRRPGLRHRRGADARLHERASRWNRRWRRGDLHFYSRSRDELWKKGETSGNFLHLRQLRYDCDGDSLVALVDPAGPACHTGERSCFYREVLGSASPRKDAPPAEGEPTRSPTKRCRRWSGRSATAPCSGPTAATR